MRAARASGRRKRAQRQALARGRRKRSWRRRAAGGGALALRAERAQRWHVNGTTQEQEWSPGPGRAGVGGVSAWWRDRCGAEAHAARACAGAARQSRSERGSNSRKKRDSCAGRRRAG
jgi:hypothetical protein